MLTQQKLDIMQLKTEIHLQKVLEEFKIRWEGSGLREVVLPKEEVEEEVKDDRVLRRTVGR